MQFDLLNPETHSLSKHAKVLVNGFDSSEGTLSPDEGDYHAFSLRIQAIGGKRSAPLDLQLCLSVRVVSENAAFDVTEDEAAMMAYLGETKGSLVSSLDEEERMLVLRACSGPFRLSSAANSKTSDAKGQSL